MPTTLVSRLSSLFSGLFRHSIAAMWPKLQVLTAASVIGICLLATTVTPTTAPALTTSTRLPVPLQPPTGPQNVTSTTIRAEEVELKRRLHLKAMLEPVSLSDSAKELNKQAERQSEPVDDLHYGSELGEPQEPEEPAEQQLEHDETTESFVGVPGFLPTVLPATTKLPPTNGHGYIQFDVNDEQQQGRRAPSKSAAKKATVNEVLYNLFPNGFSDIFRFSYPAETPSSSSSTSTTATTTTELIDAVQGTTIASQATAATTPPDSAKNQTYYSYQTTVTKEYRRELRPGHTQIVVEKIARLPRQHFKQSSSSSSSSNHISQEELLRINRAAVAAPVLPTLLLPPNDDNDTLMAAESAPIVILGEHEAELEDNQSIEDNQIAESQNLGQQIYHRRLPPPSPSGGIESYRQQHGPGQEQQINVHIVHDQSLAKAQETAEHSAPQALDHYQAHSEQHFQQRHQTAEAPSRQFLKTFKPIISGAADGPIPKGSFHYEVNSPPQLLPTRPQSEADYAGPYVRPAAQLAYQRELSHVLQQQQSQPTHRQPPAQLHTQAVASAKPDAPIDYQGYGGPTPATATPSSLLFVTLNTPHAAPGPPAQQKPLEHPSLLIPSPHEYVSEAAAEPSQQHEQHAPPPPISAKLQAEVKPNHYTFVEVQKSVNIHNKLITEKDGQLVEQHETIYHPPPYQQNHLSVDYSPKNFVTASAPPGPPSTPAPPHNYVSLAANPIHVQHVEYDSSPQEGAISHSTIHLETGSHHASSPHYSHSPQPVAIVEKLVPQPQPYAVSVEKVVDRPVPINQVVEKHVAVPYAHPVPVPVHVEHYVDRPYPVQTIVEQPVPYPYPVETVVEKIVEKHVPVEVERIVEKPVEVEKIVEKFVDRPMAIPIHVPVAIHMPISAGPSLGPFSYAQHPNSLLPWSHSSAVAHVPPKVLQNYYTRMLKKLLPQLTASKTKASTVTAPAPAPASQPPTKPLRGDAPKVATFSLADMRFDLRPPPPPPGSPWLQSSRYIYNTLPADLATAAASASAQMVKSYIGPVPATSATKSNEFDEFQRWRNGHTLKRSPDFGRNLNIQYGFKPPLVPSVEIDDKGNPLKQTQAETEM
ncbi:uncharacterized protein LOC115634577 [Scaptodrosophila lebanonensis]|uniref:Uncharacterized protein LOC115634577 n=1 Tax=Drosophila lebanonensis TaxID=7225 RepID=A0A6J2ULF7_DROLE|nr:uncharacterized protein LOC115634577 [Scaptodrosophila lebanonensis]